MRKTYNHPTTREGASVSINPTTFVVVERRGSWGDDASVTRATTIEAAHASVDARCARLLADGFQRVS